MAGIFSSGRRKKSKRAMLTKKLNKIKRLEANIKLKQDLVNATKRLDTLRRKS